MTWKIKLKEGFFRTVDCEMTLDEGQLFISPLDHGFHPDVELDMDEIVYITLNRKDQSFTELEIRTTQLILVAQLPDPSCEEPLIQALNAAFQTRLQVI